MRIRRFLASSLLLAAAPIVSVAVDAAPAAASGSFPPPTVVGVGSAPKPRQLGMPLNQPIVGMAADPNGSGLWLVASDGGVFSFGSARFHGSTGAMHLWQPIVGMAATPSGKGYWLVARDGGIFSFGDAHFYGSTGALHLTQPIIGMARTPSGKGYWLVASDGGIFTFGDAHFYGSAASLYKNGPVVGMAPTRSGKGYELLIADGATVPYGDAPVINNPSHGAPVTAIAASPTGGYWTLGRDGHVYTTGAARVGNALSATMLSIAIAPARDGKGYWVAQIPLGPPLPPNSGSGRRIVYSNSQQRVWTVESNGVVSHTWLVSGRRGTPPFATYSIQTRIPMSSSGSLRLPYFQGFLRGSSGLWFGFHGIPLRPDGTPIESDSQLGTPMSHGCVRMSQDAIKVLWDWATFGTTVVATP